MPKNNPKRNYNCAFCGSEFQKWPSQILRRKNIYCNKNCANSARLGKPAWNKDKTNLEIYGEIRSKEIANKIGIKSKGRHPVREFKKGQEPWNKGLHVWANGNHPKGMLGKESTRKGKRFEEIYGEERAQKLKEDLSNSHIGLQANEKHPNWQGGITHINKKIRHSNEYKEWRNNVFKRDDYTCQICKIRGASLHADHIKPFAYFPELRFDVNNGRTLCEDCHKTTDTYKKKQKKKELAEA